LYFNFSIKEIFSKNGESEYIIYGIAKPTILGKELLWYDGPNVTKIELGEILFSISLTFLIL